VLVDEFSRRIQRLGISGLQTRSERGFLNTATLWASLAVIFPAIIRCTCDSPLPIVPGRGQQQFVKELLETAEFLGKALSDMACCAYCGIAGVPLGRDHVVPGCLYPPSKRAQGNLQLITVPACASCNGGYSDDEAHFRNVMLMAGDSNEAVQELWQKAQRSFDEDDGERRVTELHRMMVPVKVAGEDRCMIFPGRDERVLRVVRKIVRGLAYHHSLGTAISENRVWTDVLKYPIPVGLLESVTLLRPEHDIFQYWFEATSNDEISSIWYLRFFDKRIFVASIAPS
jgi:hypothetical protein